MDELQDRLSKRREVVDTGGELWEHEGKEEQVR